MNARARDVVVPPERSETAVVTDHLAPDDGPDLRRRLRGRQPGRRDAGGYVTLRRYLAVSPLLLALCVLVLVPVAFITYGVFIDGRMGSPNATFTLDKLYRVYLSGEFLVPIRNTLLLCVSVATISVAGGAVFAWLVARTDMPWKRLCSVLVISPLMLSPFVIGFAWLVLGSPRAGLLNVLYMNVTGSPTGFFDITSVPGTILVMATAEVAYAYFFVIAALRNVDSSLEDAARINGASELRTFLSVTIPLIRPAIIASFLFVFVTTAGAFAVPALYGQLSGFSVLSYVVYLRTSIQGDHGLAAAAASILVLTTIFGVYLYRRVIAKGDKYVTISARSTAPRLVKLGGWRIGAVLAVVLYGMLAAVLPFLSLVLVSLLRFVRPDRLRLEYLSLDVFRNVLSSELFWRALRNTLVVVLVAPTITVALALVIALVTQRSRLPLKGLLDYLTTIPVAIPGLVFGLGLLWATIQTPLYGTAFLLVLAYSGRYLPEVYRIISSTVVQIDKTLEESSALCGASSQQTTRFVVAPLLKPALFSGFAVASIFVLREVPTAVMLTTPETTLLSIYTWNFAYIGDFGPAAALALMQIVLYFVILGVARYVLKVNVGPGRSKNKRTNLDVPAVA